MPHNRLGGYYTQLLVPKRVLVQDASRNWVARWVDNNKPDHYAHAEGYCLLALERAGRSGSGVRFFVEGQSDYSDWWYPSEYRHVVSATWYR